MLLNFYYCYSCFDNNKTEKQSIARNPNLKKKMYVIVKNQEEFVFKY